MIGTGASAVQVIPSIAPEVEQLTVLPAHADLVPAQARRAARARGVRGGCSTASPARRLAARALSQAFVELNFPLPAHFHGVVPLASGGERLGRKHLRRAGPRPGGARQADARATGSAASGRASPTSTCRPSTAPNVELETTPIEAITPAGVRTADGAEHEIDVLILATGFKVFEKGNMPPFPVRGGDGVDLAAVVGREPLPGLRGRQRPRLPEHAS